MSSPIRPPITKQTAFITEKSNENLSLYSFMPPQTSQQSLHYNIPVIFSFSIILSILK